MPEMQPMDSETAIAIRNEQLNSVMTAPQEFRNEFNVGTLLPTVGTLTTTKAQQKILFAPTDPDTVEIRPDGLIYLPWEEYARRLTEAFPANWALIPQGLPKFRKDESLVVWGAWLVIDGHLMGFAIGEVNYQPTNRTMSWGDACEGALSNALMRNCKRIGMHLDLWTPRFNRAWRDNYAEQYRDDKGRMVWRRRVEPLKKVPTPQNAAKDEIRDQWKARSVLVADIANNIPYYGGEQLHVLNALTKLTAEGVLSVDMPPEKVICLMERHASERADAKASRE